MRVAPSNDWQTTTLALCAYLRDHEAERQAMGAAGRRRILETFSLQRMVDGFVHIYEEALAAY